jgi:hypothetical protein
LESLPQLDEGKADEFIIRESRTFAGLLSAVALGYGLFAISGVFLRIKTSNFDPVWTSIASVQGVFFFILGIYFAVRTTQEAIIGRITREGVINKYGNLLCWHQVRKMYVFTGVLFVKERKKGWFLRIDSAQIGWPQFRRMIKYLRATAPADLTEKL